MMDSALLQARKLLIIGAPERFSSLQRQCDAKVASFDIARAEL